MPEEKTMSGKRLFMYLIGFVFNLSYAIPTYINSTFLSHLPHMNEKLVGVIYTASSILAIVAFIEIPDLIKKWGNLRVTIALLAIEFFSLLGMISGQETIAIISSFIANFVAIAIINFTFDIFLEEFSNNSSTGRIRGTFLTISNSAWLLSPTIVSFLLKDKPFDVSSSYNNVYLTSALLIIPVIALVFYNLRKIKDPIQTRVPFWKSFAEVWYDRDIKGILMIQFLLQFFYAWMVIYTPIYLYETVGFDSVTIGIIFTVMLLPFVFIQAPLGRLADKTGEKTMLSVGFFILGISTSLIAFITDHNFILWAALLFATRCGAATVEVMAETYFFKKVDASKTNIIGFSRMARPLAYIISPMVATILFLVFDMKGLFIFLGLLMLYGLRYTLSINDAK